MSRPHIYVIEDYELVILGIPKCAQTSIKRAFLSPDVVNVHNKSHFPYISHEELKECQAAGFTTVTFIRNPYDRFLSFWKQKIMVHNKFVRGATNPFNTGMSLSETVRVACNIQDDHSDIHFKSQVDQIRIDGKFPDFIGCLENIQEDWKALGDYIGKELPALPYENRTPDHNDEWTPELKRKIYTRFHKDFTILGYPE